MDTVPKLRHEYFADVTDRLRRVRPFLFHLFLLQTRASVHTAVQSKLSTGSLRLEFCADLQYIVRKIERTRLAIFVKQCIFVQARLDEVRDDEMSSLRPGDKALEIAPEHEE